MKIETKCVQSGYSPKNGEARVKTIEQSTTFYYESTEDVGKLFDLEKAGYFYTRLANPSAGTAEEKLAQLEGGSGAMMTSSGQSASLISLLNIMSAGDHVVATAALYGGTVNLFAVTMKRMGIEFTFVDPDDFDAIDKAFLPNTKAVFAESLANPAVQVLDIEKVAAIAHKHNVPLIVDNTFPTPALCRPLEWGADVVVHSSSKYLDGHAVALGGFIVDGGKFDWEKAGYKGLYEPDASYHGTSYTKAFGAQAYITKARAQLMRDLGCAPAPMNAFLTERGMETLHLRMDRHSENALKVAEFLKASKKVVKIKYPGLKTDSEYEKCQKYLGGKGSGVISFDLAGRKEAVTFMDALELCSIVVHVADVRTGVLHPASATHRQLTDRQLVEAGISPGTIRLSVGIENADDIIADLSNALSKI